MASSGRSSLPFARRYMLEILQTLKHLPGMPTPASLSLYRNPPNRGGRRHQGAPGRGSAVGGSLLSVGERGRTPCRRPLGRAKNPRVLRCFVLFPFFAIFSAFVAQAGSTWANIGFKMGQHSSLKRGQHSLQILLPARPISPQHGPLAGCRA